MKKVNQPNNYTKIQQKNQNLKVNIKNSKAQYLNHFQQHVNAKRLNKFDKQMQIQNAESPVMNMKKNKSPLSVHTNPIKSLKKSKSQKLISNHKKKQEIIPNSNQNNNGKNPPPSDSKQNFKLKKNKAKNTNHNFQSQKIQKKNTAVEVRDYIVINDNIYSANTFTQRNTYDQFLNKVKKQKQIQRQRERGSFFNGNDRKSQNSQNNSQKNNIKKHQKNNQNKDDSVLLKHNKNQQPKKSLKKTGSRIRTKPSFQELVKNMSVSDKLQIFKKLQKQIRGEYHQQQQPQFISHNKSNYNYGQQLSSNNSKQSLSRQGGSHDSLEYFEKFQQYSNNGHQVQNSSHFHFQNRNKSVEAQQSLPPISQSRSSLQKRHKFHLLEQKLQTIKMQLQFKWQGQIQKVNNLYEQQKMSFQQREAKISLMQNIKQHKMKIIQCTRVLFMKILSHEEYQKQKEKTENYQKQKSSSNNGNDSSSNYFEIQNILKSLHSFSSFQHLDFQSFDKKTQQQPVANNLTNFQQIDQNNNQILKLSQKQAQPLEKSPIQNLSEEILQPPLQPKKEPFSNLNVLQVVNANGNYQTNNFQIKNWSIVGHDQNQGKTQNNIEKHNENENEHEHEHEHENEDNASSNLELNLKLDLRIDEVVLFQDHYSWNQQVSEEKQIFNKLQQKKSEQKDENQEQKIQKIQNKQIFTIPLSSQQPSLFLNLQKKNDNNNGIISQTPSQMLKLKFKKTFDDDNKQKQKADSQQNESMASLICHEKTQKISIPLILTRDKMQNLQFQKNKTFKQNVQRHMGFQLGCLQLDVETQSQSKFVQQGSQAIQQSSNSKRLFHNLDPDIILMKKVDNKKKPKHFTSLFDINTYLINFYQFMMKKYLDFLVDNLNTPFGKSVIDKLYCIQRQGEVPDQKNTTRYNIFNEAHFEQYQKQMTLTMRKCSEYETFHNKAVFQTFNSYINQYRPYYQSQGQIYNWLVSQKGITFYQINDQNIEQVFQKSKIKVLQTCSSLCGLMSPTEPRNEQQRLYLQNRRKQPLNKYVNSSVIQSYGDWNIKKVNYETIIRMILTEKIWEQELTNVINQMKQIGNQKPFNEQQFL